MLPSAVEKLNYFEWTLQKHKEFCIQRFTINKMNSWRKLRSSTIGAVSYKNETEEDSRFMRRWESIVVLLSWHAGAMPFFCSLLLKKMCEFDDAVQTNVTHTGKFHCLI